MKLAIFDWKGTLFEAGSEQLIDGAEDLLNYLHQRGVELVLIGKDQGGDMYKMVKKLKLDHLFSDIQFVSSDKSADLFGRYASKYQSDDVWVVGDRIKGEIYVGNAIGAKTVWVRQGKFAKEKPTSEAEKPDFVCTSLAKLSQLFEQHFEARSSS